MSSGRKRYSFRCEPPHCFLVLLQRSYPSVVLPKVNPYDTEHWDVTFEGN